MTVPGSDYYRQIAAQLREVASGCQFAITRKEILNLAARLAGRADHLERAPDAQRSAQCRYS
jgi:hypothetical protein